jgi:hypothetical protein
MSRFSVAFTLQNSEWAEGYVSLGLAVVNMTSKRKTADGLPIFRVFIFDNADETDDTSIWYSVVGKPSDNNYIDIIERALAEHFEDSYEPEIEESVAEGKSVFETMLERGYHFRSTYTDINQYKRGKAKLASTKKKLEMAK